MMVFVLALAAQAGLWDEVESRRAAPEAFALMPARDRWDLAILARDIVRHAPSGLLPHTLQARASGLGWSLQEHPGFVVLTEEEGTGRGLLAVRLGPVPGDRVLQAPHPWYDLNTGRIACRTFEESSSIRALVVATVHRRAAADSDAAHSPEQGFQALTQGVVDGLSAPFVVQLHGYGVTTDADAVLSAGSTWMQPGAFEAARARLGAALDLDDVRTGEDVPALAAKTNVQGRLVTGAARFLHVELSKRVRETLLADPEARAALVQALGPEEDR